MNDMITTSDSDTSWSAADTFVAEMNKVCQDEHLEPTDFSSYITGKLSIDAQAHLLFQIIGAGVDLENDKPNTHGKLLAMSIAEVMGPDYMQGFYRLVVLATKLA